MKNLLLSSAAVLAMTGIAQAQNASAIQAAIDGGLEMLNSEGANITYDSREVGSDNSIMFSGVRMAPDDGEELQITTDWIKFAPAEDMPGGVTVTIAPAVSINAMPEGDEPVEISVASDGFALTTNLLLGGLATPMMNLDANSLAVTGGDESHPFLKRLNVSQEDLSVSFNFDMATQNGEAALSMAKLLMDYKITEPGGDEFMETVADSDGLNISFKGTSLPISGDEDAVMAFMSGGGTFEIDMESGKSSSKVSSNMSDFPISMESSADGGTAAMSLLAGEFLYETAVGTVNYTITPNPEILPFPPFNVSMSGLDMGVQMPVGPSDDMKEAKLLIGLRDLVVSDTVWGMIDPAGTIPRDPATLEIDIRSALKLFVNLAEAEDTNNPMEVGQVEKVDLNRVFLSAAGALVEASGGVTMDNSGPFPMPNGAVDISVEGIQGLAQKLVELGLIEQMEVGMMMGMVMAFAEQGSEPDTFTSKIEFKDGGVFANGQPIQ